MITHDLCITWNWEYDADFVALLDAACQARGLSLLQVTPYNLVSVWLELVRGQLAFRALFDRASDEQMPFLRIVSWARGHGVRRINAHEKARSAWDKVTMHYEFGQAGLRTPYTIIIPSFDAQTDLPPLDLSALGPTFTVKPACRGGGQGVVNNATSMTDVLLARQLYPADRYLLQGHVIPATLGTQQAWFRIIYCTGHAFLCWWNTQTHLYTPVSPAEEAQYALAPLRDIAARIAQVCGLDLFSSEIALTVDGTFVAVDYVNDPLDLRLQSKTPQGVPDGIVRAIAERLAALTAQEIEDGE